MMVLKKKNIVRLGIFFLMLTSFYVGTELLLGNNASSMSPLSSSDDIYEENDSYDQAYPIEKGQEVEAEDGWYEAILQDEDWYVLNLGEGENVSILILFYEEEFQDYSENVEVAYYSADHITQVGNIDIGPGIIQISMESAPSTGEYFIYLNPNELPAVEYQMILWPYMEDKYEENDEISSAAEISENFRDYPEMYLYALDDDWYKLYLEPGWDLSGYIWYLSCADINIEFFGPDQTTLLNADIEYEDYAFQMEVYFELFGELIDSAGFYYIHIELLQGSSLYDMDIEITGNPLQPPRLYPITPNPNDCGYVRLDWNSDNEASYYTLYREKSVIIDVSSLTPIADNLPNSNYNDVLTENGTFYYSVTANDGSESTTPSNCENVEVVILPFTERFPILETIYWNDDDYGRVGLNWEALYGADYYLIYRDTIEIVDYSHLDSIDIVQKNYDDQNYFDWSETLEENGTYYYAIVGVRGDQYSRVSNSESVTISIRPFTERKNSYFDVNPSYTEDGYITLYWNGVRDAQEYYLYRETTIISDFTELIPLAIRGNYNFEDIVTENGTYYYCIVPYNGIEFGLPSFDSVEVKLVPFIERVPVLRSIYWHEIDYEEVDLRWNSFRDANQYLIYRDTSEIISIAGMEPVGLSENPYFTDKIQANGTYYYVILATNGFETSKISNCESVTVNIIPFDQRIVEYIDIYPTTSDTGEIQIFWDNLHGAISYAIYRETSEIIDISTLTPIYTSYSDTYWVDHISVNGTYWYAVVANNGTINSALSDSRSATVAIIPFSERHIAYLDGHTELNNEWVHLNWNTVYGAISYEIYRSTSFITDISGMTAYSSSSDSDWNENIDYNGTFYYVVRAFNGSFYTPISNCVMIEQIFLPFYELETYFYGINSYDDGRVYLDWKWMEEAEYYEIYRSTSEITDISGMTPINIASYTYDTSFNDYVDESGLYYYVVVGNNGTHQSKVAKCQSVYVDIIPFHERIPYLSCNYDPISGEVRLQWESFYDAEMYYIYRLDFQPDGIDGLSPIVLTPNNFYEEILDSNDTFYYVVVGYDGVQISHVSNCQRVETNLLPFWQLKPLLTYSYYDPEHNQLNLEWRRISGASNYFIYRDTEPILSLEGLNPIGIQNDDGEDDWIWYYDNPDEEGSFFYSVVAYNGNQMSLPSNSREVHIFKPDFTQRNPSFHVCGIWNNQGKVSLHISGIEGDKLFYIYRNTTEISSIDGLEPIGEIENSINSDTYFYDIVPNNGEYFYAVIANNGTINSTIVTCDSVNIDGIEDVETPEILNHNQYPSGQVYFYWNSQEYAAEYLIYREMSNITDVTGLTPYTSTFDDYFNDYSVGTNDTYYYAIIARNGLYTSNISNCINVSITVYEIEESPTISEISQMSFDEIYLDWNDVSYSNIYYVYRDSTDITSISGMNPIGVRYGSSYYYDYDITAEGIYYYVVVAGNGAGNSSISNCISISIEYAPPIAPTLQLISPPLDLDGQITFEWTEVELTEGYYIYRCDTEIFDPTKLILVGRTSSLSYTDWVSNNQNYHYAIVAYNQYGFSDFSNIESVENNRPAIPNYAYVSTTYEWIDTSSYTILQQGESPTYIGFDLPFDFDFYGITYSSMYISKNGYISFTDPSPYNDWSYIFPTSYYQMEYTISPFLEYFGSGTLGNVSILNGTGYCAISWENMEYYGNYDISFQVILYDDGSIKFQYDHIGGIESETRVGLNMGDGIHGELYTGLTTQTDDFAFMYVPYLENANPSMTLPDDLSYFSNDIKTYSLSWTITDPDVYQPLYRIIVDGEVIIDDTVWTSGSSINFDVTGWDVGQHLVMIFIEDGFGGIVVDYVWIFVEEIPIIWTAGDLSFDESDTQPQILTWTIIDTTYKSPTYNITLDGVVMIENEPWPGNKSISYDVSTLAVGNYVVELIVNDGMGNSARDAVVVSVYSLSDDLPQISSPEDITYYAGSNETYVLSWTITDVTVNNPTYTIEVDGTIIVENEAWISGDIVEFDVSGWEEGEYTVKIIVNDGNNGEAIDVVVVTVTGTPNNNPFNLESIPGFNIFYLISLSIVMVGLIKVRKYT